MLSVWLPLTGDFHNQGLDNEMTSITGTGCSFSNDGKIGSCLKLGYTNNLTIPSLVGAKQLSIAYWCRVDTATSTNWLDPIRFYSTDGSTTQYSRQEFYNNCTQTGFWYAGGSLGGWNGVEVGVWNHYATTFNYETGVVEFYINGEKKYTQTNLNTTHYVSGINIRLGDSGLAISENDMRIYDHVLSAKEVAEIAKGLVLHYPLSMPGGENLAKNTSTITDPSSNGRVYQLSSTIPSGTTVTISCRIDADNITLSGNKRLGLSTAFDKTDGTGKYWFETWKSYWNGLSDGSSFHGYISNTEVIPGDMTSISAYLQTVSSGTVTISKVKVEIGDKRTPWLPNPADAIYSALGFNDGIEYDVSGYGNNGIVNGTLVVSSDSPKYNTSTQIDGSTITCASGLVSVADPVFSVSLWFRLKSNTSYTIYQDLINFASPSYSNQPFRLEICGSPVGNDICWFRGPTGSVGGFKVNNTALSRDVWYHTVLVSEGNKQYSYYMNGVKQGTYNGSENTWTPTGSVRIGDSIAGKIDISDFRIYATCLSPQDVRDLYSVAASVADNGTLMASEVSEV